MIDVARLAVGSRARRARGTTWQFCDAGRVDVGRFACSVRVERVTGLA